MATNTKSINLALQGGGAHGAFTWGVLDRVLEDGRLWIDAISGTSAGAMNAVVVADGLMRNGCEGAREALYRFWWEVSCAARFSPIRRAPLDMFMGNWSLDCSPGYVFLDFLSRLASPYELNPWKLNPLQDVLEKVVDFDLVRSCNKTKVFISATNVETGRVKVFDRRGLTSDMVMASACLPYMFQAVEIDGVPYWDGGFMGNPVLFPFHDATECRDIMIVQINPIERKGAPRTARDILNRMNEITFNGSLLKELRSVDFVRRLVEQGQLDPKHYKQVNVHIVEAQDDLGPLGASSKMNAEWEFLRHLFAIGRRAADGWLARHFDDIGEHSTVDLREMFQGIGALHHG
ncbi:MAG: patatin-like phospholipase family protein [Hyphomicrobiaceae bacterium]